MPLWDCSKTYPDCQPCQPIFVSKTDSLCLNSTYTLGGQDFTQPGSYQIALTTLDGCDSTINLTLLQKTQPYFPTIGPQTFCPGDSVTVSAQAPNLTNYEWSNGQNGPNPTATFNSAGLFWVTVTGANGCTDSQSFAVSQSAMLSPMIIGNAVLCAGATDTLSVSSVFGSYQWSTGAVGQFIIIQQPGPYSVTVSQGGCSGAGNFSVQAGALPSAVATATPSSVCGGQSVTLTATGGGNYLWSNNNTLATFSDTPLVPTNYQVTVTGQNGCTKSASASVTVNFLPLISINGPSLACNGKAVILQADSLAGAGYKWSNGQTGSTISPTIAADQTFYVTVTDANGCTATASKMIAVEAVSPASIAALPDPIVCFDTLEVSANLPSGASGHWFADDPVVSFDNDNAATTTARDLSNGLNTLNWQLSTPNCPNYSQAEIKVYFENNLPILKSDTVRALEGTDVEVRFLQNDFLPPNSDFEFDLFKSPVNAGGQFFWTDSLLKFNSTQFGADTLLFGYSATNEECPAQADSAMIMIEYFSLPAGQTMEVSITPNGDNMNDVLVFPFLEDDAFPNNRIQIFNRWGSIIYQAKPYKNDWKGEFKGRPLPEGTFFYYLYLGAGRPSDVQKGSILLLR